MLGLIQKDIYQMLKYQRVLMLIVVIFAIASAKNQDNAFFLVYPSVIAGLSTVTMQSYDEQGGFSSYSAVMPVSRKTVVGEKYLYGIAMVVLMALLEAVSYLVFQNSISDAVRNVGFTTVAGLLCISVFLPFIFWLGVERGRTAYVVAIGVFCALTLLLKEQLTTIPSVTIGVALALCLVLAAVSYGLSVAGYSRREL